MGKGTNAKAQEKERQKENKIMQVFPNTHSDFKTTFLPGDTYTWPRAFENVAPKS